jgi:hypothetical protein
MIGHKYPIVDHEYDAIVVGAGGSGEFRHRVPVYSSF